MSTFKVRIEDYVGAVGDDTFLGDALTDTAAEIIRAIPDDKVKSFTQESVDITAASTNIANHRIVSVIRERGTEGEYVECRELPVKYFRKLFILLKIALYMYFQLREQVQMLLKLKV